MSISALAFRYRRIVMVGVAGLMAVGAVNFFALPAREDPAITIREAVVSTRFPGMSAERVEDLITQTLEESIREIPEIDEIRSVSMDGVSIIHVEAYQHISDLDPVWDDLRERVSESRGELPDGASVPVVNDQFGDVAVITAALTGPEHSDDELYESAKKVRDRLYSVQGTKRIDLVGVQPERIYVDIDTSRLAQLDVSSAAIGEALATQNIEVPVGSIDVARQTLYVETSGDLTNIDALRSVLVPSRSGANIPLGELADVGRGPMVPMAPKAYYNGERSITFAISMLEGERVLEYAPLMRGAIEDARRDLPAGVSLEIITYQADPVEASVYGVSLNVLQTLGIVLAVVMLFLGVRTGMIVGVIVPIVMLVTLAVMGWLGMSLERMSLATLVIALGLLVDNGIVIAEDFKTRLDEGLERFEALKKTGRELAIPLLSSTATTVLFFLPLMLAQHGSGEYTRSVSLVILISLSASWLMALTVTPTLCYFFVKKRDEEKSSITDRLFDSMNAGYERALRAVMRHKWIFGGVIVALFVGAGALMAVTPKKFFPDSDRMEVLAYVDLPSGTSARQTDGRVQQIHAAIDGAALEHVGNYASYVGFGGPRFVLSLTPIDPAPNKAFFVFNVDGRENVEETARELRSMFRESFDDVSAQVTTMFLGPSDSRILELQVRGPDERILRTTADELARLMASIPNTIDVHQHWEQPRERLHIDVDQTRARRAGVNSERISQAVTASLAGIPRSVLREDDDLVPIVLRGRAGQPLRLGQLETLPLATEAGFVPLSQVASLRVESVPSRIERVDLQRSIAVEAKNTRIAAEDMLPQIQSELEGIRAGLPPGYRVVVDGVVAESAEGQAALAANVPICFALILVLLMIQFNSFRRTSIIVLTIPLVFVGAVVGLFVLGEPFGFMVILGLYSLAGIIVNNAIVLIDRIDIERAESDESVATEAIVSAAVRRLRPIVMTTVTTILGLLPLIIGRDVLFAGMASAIAFGLAFGTIFTLGVVPILYGAMFRKADSRNKTDAPSEVMT